MHARFLALTLACLAAAAPLAWGHSPAGTPKPYCELGMPGERATHDYGPPASGEAIMLAQDGSVPPCPYDDPFWDGHLEFAFGGAWLLACDHPCGEHLGEGATYCWGTYADHAQFPEVRVVDAVLTPQGLPVAFTVMADTLDNTGEPTTTCGDFEVDWSIDCVDVCTVPFPASLDGSYQVYVQGTSGHVLATGAPGYGGP